MGYANRTEDKLFIPVPFATMHALDHALAGRTTDLYFAHEDTLTQTLTLHLPEGFTVAEMPEGVVGENDALSVAATLEPDGEGSTVQVKQTVVMHRGVFKPQAYRAAALALTRLHELSTEVITAVRMK